jgi:peroxiredoxin/predicted 2-oxoglutarate/Fe(II)-dependent dioxygenase YbiX
MQPAERSVLLTMGEPAPWFICRSRATERYLFHTVAGRYVVLSFLGSTSHPNAANLLASIRSNRNRFDDQNVAFFGVSVDPKDASRPSVVDWVPGIRFLWDFERSISRLYGVVKGDDAYRLVTYVLDPALRVVAVLRNVNEKHPAELYAVLDRLPPIARPSLAAGHAPVLVLPRVFEPQLCKDLIDYFDRLGGKDGGFVEEVNGKTAAVIDHAHKKRGDRAIEDRDLCHACMIRIRHRVAPMVQRAFQVNVTRIERYMVSCYDADIGGYFRPHRDNTTKGTAHRQFAVSLFLNSGEYEGGHLHFPEFSSKLYSAPLGGAVVFSCSLLHEATPVTRGRRYMFLPFLYDDAASVVRQENLKYLDESIAR